MYKALPSLKTIVTIFGTRPELIKLAPVLRQLDLYPNQYRSIVVCTGQHTTLLEPLITIFNQKIHHQLEVMKAGQSLNLLASRLLAALDPILESTRADLVLVQGDTTTALAGAIAAFQRKIPVGHVEAGLRTDNLHSPFPEEANRRMISRIAQLHFAATPRNKQALRDEGIPDEQIALTGNPVVDALEYIGKSGRRSELLQKVLDQTQHQKRLVLTTHRRESFGKILEGNLQAIRNFVEKYPDICVLFPVHPNPTVTQTAHTLLGNVPRVHLLPPLDYPDFIALLSESWLIASDSGGIQEEAPSLGKPLIVLRESTERPEAIQAGVAKLAPTPKHLGKLLELAYQGKLILNRVGKNPFGHGDAGQRIVQTIGQYLQQPHQERNLVSV